MKKRILIPALIFLLALVIFPLVIVLSLPGEDAPAQNSEFSEETGFLLGTVIRVKIYGEEDPALFERIFRKITEYEALLSVNMEESQVSRLNRAAGSAPVPVDPVVFEVVQKGMEYSMLSGGLFDITIGPLVDLWKIGHENARVPEESEIESVLPLVDYNKLVIDEEKGTLFLPEEGMALDLGGIAKGYIADLTGEMLGKAGRTSALINLGGNVLALGAKPEGDPFKIGVQNPHSDRGEYLGIVSVIDKSVVTSGAYERFLEYEGKRYHHILNPFTGYPMESDIDQVTVISDLSVDGDGLSTALFSFGLRNGLKLVNSLQGVDAIFITPEKDIYLSEGLDESFKVTDTEYKLSYIQP